VFDFSSDLSYLDGKNVLITGGTGSLGKVITKIILEETKAAKVVIFSRDEFKQHEMVKKFKKYNSDGENRIRFFIGDVRNADRLRRSFKDIDYVIHAAALKQVPAAEYNPFEFVMTNVIGAENIINAAIDTGVKKVIALSTDKAANPINLYGATKLCSDKIFSAGNSYSGEDGTRFSIVRYGNVFGSRGSVLPLFLEKRHDAKIPVTDKRMTRFWITIDNAARFVLRCLDRMYRGEVWVPRIPSTYITNIAKIIAPDAEIEEIGIRPGEKLHEVMISRNSQAVRMNDCYVIKPECMPRKIDWDNVFKGKVCDECFEYSSEKNDLWLDRKDLIDMICDLDLPEVAEWKKEMEI